MTELNYKREYARQKELQKTHLLFFKKLIIFLEPVILK